MKPIKYLDRASGKICDEQVYGARPLQFLYGKKLSNKLLGRPIAHLASRIPFISGFYGWLQKRPSSKKKVLPFIQRFNINTSEFLEDVSTYQSFNDFFIRKLKPTARPIATGDNVAVIPADGRYRFIPNIQMSDGFIVKGQKFSLPELLGDAQLASEYKDGSLVMARLCPVDYHRFHFPCAGLPGPAKLIRGHLYSVNPIALKQNIAIYTENKRKITVIEDTPFGKVLYIEVGATNVGTIHETYTPGKRCSKGEEKGYFSFGGSALLLLFLPGSIHFDEDLLVPSDHEILCQMGQSMGVAIR